MLVCVFAVTPQRCDNHQGTYAIMFGEDSQIDFTEENILLNISLRPLLPPDFTLHSKIDNQFKLC